jgi:hypothetical protein
MGENIRVSLIQFAPLNLPIQFRAANGDFDGQFRLMAGWISPCALLAHSSAALSSCCGVGSPARIFRFCSSVVGEPHPGGFFGPDEIVSPLVAIGAQRIANCVMQIMDDALVKFPGCGFPKRDQIYSG